MRYFLELSYNGLSYHGWQCQPNSITVQEVIENALSTVLKKDIGIIGSGRTDTGVHARQMFAHFDSDYEILNPKKFLLSLNSLVGNDISIYNLYPVSSTAHARFDAETRTYKYFVTYSKNPFLRNYCWHSPSPLDIKKMNEAGKLIQNANDFTSFAKLHSDTKTNLCSVEKAIWQPIEHDSEAKDFIGNLNNGIVFTIKADRFLRNMVRAIVGTMIEVGRGKLSLEGVKKIIEEKNRCSAGTSMPGNALFLWRITYPYIPQSNVTTRS